MVPPDTDDTDSTVLVTSSSTSVLLLLLELHLQERLGLIFVNCIVKSVVKLFSTFTSTNFPVNHTISL